MRVWGFFGASASFCSFDRSWFCAAVLGAVMYFPKPTPVLCCDFVVFSNTGVPRCRPPAVFLRKMASFFSVTHSSVILSCFQTVVSQGAGLRRFFFRKTRSFFETVGPAHPAHPPQTFKFLTRMDKKLGPPRPGFLI